MGLFDFIHRKKKVDQERLKKDRQTESKKQHQGEEDKLSKYQILDFYLDCSHWRQQNEILKKTPLALPIKRIDVNNDNDIVMQYQVKNLPKLILVDYRGKEIKRWKGVTESNKINDYLYENGYATKPSNKDTQDTTDVLIEGAKKIDIKLAGQFVTESMASDFGYKPRAIFSDDFNIFNFQAQYASYCLMAKSNLVLDLFENTNPLMSALKAHLLQYLSDSSNRTNKAMKHLYELEDRTILIQQLGMLTLHANMKRVNDIGNISNDEMRNALNPESVALCLGMYVYFTILANDSVSEADFNELFVESWIEYFGDFYTRLFMLRMRGNNWKDNFNGVLMAD